MTRGERLLVADGDAEVRTGLAELFERAGLSTALAADGSEALKLFYRERPDAVVLGLELPQLSGWDALSTIRELSDVPVMVLAERELETEQVRALRAGADDFISKPFGKAEVLARIEALLRRPRVEETADLFADDFVRIDHQRHQVTALGEEVELTPTEFKLLAAFCRHVGQALTHSQLLNMVWGDGQRDRSEVKLYVSYVRRKLRAAGVEPIETVRGVGYRYSPHPTEPTALG